MVMQTQPGDGWDEYDFLLLEAYQILEDERCSQCGLPRWICHNEDSDIRIELTDDTCFVKREIDAERELHSKDSNYKEPHGTVSRPQVSSWAGRPLDFVVREQYYKDLIATKSET